MPTNTPFVSTGYVYDTDESSKFTSSAEIHAKSVTNDEETSGTFSTVDGSYSVDLGNLTTQWAVGDIIQLVVISSDKMGFYIGQIQSEEVGWDNHLYVQPISDIQGELDAIGERVTVQATTVSTDSYGHQSVSTTDYIIKAIVTMMGTEADHVKEGLLDIGDLVLYASPSDTNKQYLILGNYVVYDGDTYKIRRVIKEKGTLPGQKWSHYEVMAEKLD